MSTVTSVIRKQIIIEQWSENATHIQIMYKKGGVTKHLSINKLLHKNLMDLVDQDEPVSQYDCINIVVEQERTVRFNGIIYDMAPRCAEGDTSN